MVSKTWVLDTETKGTGAHVAPLRDAERERATERDLSLTRFRAQPPPPPPPARREPRRFRVVDIQSGRILADGVSASGAVAALEQMRSPLDVRVHVLEPSASRWRLLTLAETRALWAFRGERRQLSDEPEPAAV
jgi:hypothetical protein